MIGPHGRSERLTSSQQQGHLSVSDGLLGQVVEDDQGVLSVVSEVLSHGGTRERSQVLQRSGVGSGSGDDDRVLHGVVLLQGLDELGDGGPLLSDGDVDTVQLLLLVRRVVEPLLVEDGVEGDGGLSGLSVTDDQLSLTSTDGNHRVDRLETGQHGLVDGSSGQDTGSLGLGSSPLGRVDGTLSVDGVTERVDDTTQELHTDGDVDNGTGSLDRVTLLDGPVGTEDGDTDVVGLQVQGHTLNTRGEFNHLLGCDANRKTTTSVRMIMAIEVCAFR